VGRRGTLLTLYVHGLRACFGLGRRATSKIFPWALAIFAFVPAIIQLGVGAVVSGFDQKIELFKHEDYFTYVRIILVLFCATVASELVGAKRVIPSHYGTFSLLTGTPEAMRDLLPPEVELIAPAPGETVVL